MIGLKTPNLLGLSQEPIHQYVRPMLLRRISSASFEAGASSPGGPAGAAQSKWAFWPTALAVGTLSSVLMVACGDSGAPIEPNPLNLSARVIVDATTFRLEGDFALDLVPSDRHGNIFVEDPWTVSTTLEAPASRALATISSGVQPADTQPVASAILIDDSGSMITSDPDRQRATAAQLFWRDILAARPGNLVALLDFGRGNTAPTPGFQQTNLLASFTADQGVLEAGLQQVQAVPGAGTPLYRSAEEVTAWMDSTTPSTYQRTLVIITDGKPGDPPSRDSLFVSAASRHVRIFAVGIAGAGEHDPPTAAAMLVQELATRTGGIYAAADAPIELQNILRTLAKAASPERLLVHLRLSPAPASGTAVAGTVTVVGERGSATASWSFIAP
jgi:hypothetical protein